MNGDRPRPRILLTGGTGQVGWELRRSLAPLGEVIAPTSRELDLADADSVRQAVRRIRPSIVANAAAYTAVDAAENEPDAAHAINAVAPGVLAEQAASVGALLVHYSTDYVFEGDKTTPYGEDDAPGPLGEYGRTKLAGERAITAGDGPHLIFRTSWVYGLHGKNFLLTVRRLARERDELRVVDDQWGAPTWSRMIAEATAATLNRIATDDGFDPGAGRSGIYHLSAGGETTWCRFARAIIASDPTLVDRRDVPVHAISTADYPTPAARPAHSVLNCARLRRNFGIEMPHWGEQLEMCLQDE